MYSVVYDKRMTPSAKAVKSLEGYRGIVCETQLYYCIHSKNMQLVSKKCFENRKVIIYLFQREGADSLTKHLVFPSVIIVRI